MGDQVSCVYVSEVLCNSGSLPTLAVRDPNIESVTFVSLCLLLTGAAENSVGPAATRPDDVS